MFIILRSQSSIQQLKAMVIEMTEELKRDFKGIWIPRELWEDENMTKMEMLLFVELDSLSSYGKGCFASNKYLSKFLHVSSSRISQLISSLTEKEYIKVKLIYAKDNPKQVIKREIYPINYLNRVVNKLSDPTENTKSPYLENCEDSVPGLVNHVSNKDIVEQAQPDIPYQQIIDYLNEKTSKQFKNSKSNQKYIKLRIDDGFDLDDFKSVIDNMIVVWLNDPKMNKYLRPRTLFADKFEDYLNSKPVSKSSRGNEHRHFEQETDWNKYNSEEDNLTDAEKEAETLRLQERLRRMRRERESKAVKQ